MPIHTSDFIVPLSIFSTKKYTVLESLVKYLIDERNMTKRDAAKLIGKSGKTIWTVHARVKKKAISMEHSENVPAGDG